MQVIVAECRLTHKGKKGWARIVLQYDTERNWLKHFLNSILFFKYLNMSQVVFLLDLVVFNYNIAFAVFCHVGWGFQYVVNYLSPSKTSILPVCNIPPVKASTGGITF